MSKFKPERVPPRIMSVSPTLSKRITRLLKTVSSDSTKVDYLVNKIRRSNLLSFGVPEGTEKNDTVVDLHRFLPEILGRQMQEDSPLQIERAAQMYFSISIYPDFSAAVQKKHKPFASVKNKKLQVAGIWYAMTLSCYAFSSVRGLQNEISIAQRGTRFSKWSERKWWGISYEMTERSDLFS